LDHLRHRGSLTEPTLTEPSISLRLLADPDVQTLAEGRVLLGGSPFRALRLSEGGATQVACWFGGAPVDPGAAPQALARRLLDAGMAHPHWGGSPLRAADVTAIVPVRDDHDGLDRTVRALASSGVSAIVVVDDGSAMAVSETELRLAAPEQSVAVVRHDMSLGPGAARNAARPQVQTPLIAFVDADVVPQPGWLQPLLGHFADPEVMAVAPRVQAAEGTGVLDRYEATQSPLDLGDVPALVKQRSRVSYVPSACLLARGDVPHFDEALRFGEDVDLIWRMVDAGAVVRYEPGSTVTHRNRRDVAAMMRQRLGYGSAAGPLGARHPDAIAPVVISKWSAAVWGLVAIGQPALGAVTAGASIIALRRLLENLPDPTRQAARLIARTQGSAVRQLADASTRSWWPVSFGAALVSRRARVLVGLAAVGPKLSDWARDRPELDPMRYTTLRLLDDVSYGAGVWKGAAAAQSLAALVPSIGSATRPVQPVKPPSTATMAPVMPEASG